MSYDTEYDDRKGQYWADNCTVTSSGGAGGAGWSGVDVAAPQSQQEFVKKKNCASHTTGAGGLRGARHNCGGTHAIVCSARLLRLFLFFLRTVFRACRG